MKNGSLEYNGSSNKGNNIGTSYLGSGSESAFKGLGLRAIIESLSRSSFPYLAGYHEIGQTMR